MIISVNLFRKALLANKVCRSDFQVLGWNAREKIADSKVDDYVIQPKPNRRFIWLEFGDSSLVAFSHKDIEGRAKFKEDRR